MFDALEPIDNGDGTVTIGFKDELAGPRRFLRLRVTLR